MTKSIDAVANALDALYAARPSEFVALRKKLSAEAKSAGDKEASAKISEARRPTATARAVNHVVRENPDVVTRFTEAVDALRDAQRKMLGARSSDKTSGSADRANLNDVIGELLNLARAALESEDVAWNPGTQRRIATSLRTFPMATPENQNRFLRGLLEKDLDMADDDTLLQTTLGLADHEIAELPRREPIHHTPARSPAPDRRDDELRKKEEAAEAKRAAEDLERRIRVRDRRADELDRQADRLEERAKEAEASAARARALADAARADAKKARDAKP